METSVDYTCDVCNEFRPSLKSLRRHLLSKHDRRFSVRTNCSEPYPPEKLKAAREALSRDRLNPDRRRRLRQAAPASASCRVSAIRQGSQGFFTRPHAAGPGDGFRKPRSTHSSTRGTASSSRSSSGTAAGGRDTGSRSSSTSSRRSRGDVRPSSPYAAAGRDGDTRRSHSRSSSSSSRNTRRDARPSSSSGAAGDGDARRSRDTFRKPETPKRSRSPRSHYRPAGLETSDSGSTTPATDLSDGAILDEFFDTHLTPQFPELADPQDSASLLQPSTSTAAGPHVPVVDGDSRPAQHASSVDIVGDIASPSSSEAAASISEVILAPQVPVDASSASPQDDPKPLPQPLDICPIPFDEIAAMIDTHPTSSSAVIVELLLRTRVFSERNRALVIAAVGAAVATHRLQAQRLIAIANLALGCDPSGTQLWQDVSTRLNAASSRPY